jgi:hypothetical protein
VLKKSIALQDKNNKASLETVSDAITLPCSSPLLLICDGHDLMASCSKVTTLSSPSGIVSCTAFAVMFLALR